MSFSVAGAAYLEKKALFLKQGSCSLLNLRIYRRFVIGWGVIGAQSDAELLTVSRIQTRSEHLLPGPFQTASTCAKSSPVTDQWIIKWP